jgi:hypothetical protein
LTRKYHKAKVTASELPADIRRLGLIRARRDFVADCDDGPMLATDDLALDPPIAAAAIQVRRGWTALERMSRAVWLYAVPVEFRTM